MFKLFNKSKEPKKRTYTLQTTEACCVGDMYEYTIEATSYDEALGKLVEYFFGERKFGENVKSHHSDISFPGRGYTSTNLPLWFFRRISGHWEKSDNDKMIEFARSHGIKLRNDLE